MEISVRQIQSEDGAAVTALSRQLGYPLAVEQIVSNIIALLRSKDHDAFVAVYDNKVVGWIGVAQTIMIESPPFCEVNGLVIDENYRGKGIGKLLVEKARNWARERGNRTLRLRCNVKRVDAHKFYEHLGFKPTKLQTTFEINSAN